MSIIFALQMRYVFKNTIYFAYSKYDIPHLCSARYDINPISVPQGISLPVRKYRFDRNIANPHGFISRKIAGAILPLQEP